MGASFLWLDFLIFGSGHGMGAPYFDQNFFWLNGDLYTWIGGHGAQLMSRQWRHPRPGERRILVGREFLPFQSTRRGPRVEISWAMVDIPKDINEANVEIRVLKSEICGKF